MDGKDGSHLYRQHFKRDAGFRVFYFKGEKVLRKLTTNTLFLLLLSSPVQANVVTPSFTQGSMQSTTTTTVDIDRTIEREIMGGDYTSWSGSNVTPSSDIAGDSTTFSVTTAGDPWSLEITTRDAGVVETIDITETIDQTSTTTSLSIFSQ